MMLKKKPANTPVRAADYNRLVDAVNDVLNGISLGEGLQGFRLPGQLMISAKRGRLVTPTGGTESELDQTQGTQDVDTWTRSTDDCPVAVHVLTDIKYDTSTHKVTFRTREFSFDRGGNLSAIGTESALVEVTTAVPES